MKNLQKHKVHSKNKVRWSARTFPQK